MLGLAALRKEILRDTSASRTPDEELAVEGSPEALRALPAAPGEEEHVARMRGDPPANAADGVLRQRIKAPLDRRDAPAADLLHSSALAVLFLDPQLHLRFCTAAADALLGLRPEHVGQSVAALPRPSPDPWLADDAALVLAGGAPCLRDIAANGLAFRRRAALHASPEGLPQGVVVTYTDASECQALAQSLRAAQERMDRAAAANARFISSIGHDLRQPLQTLCLLQSLAMRAKTQEAARRLIAQMEPMTDAISAILDRLRDLGRMQTQLVAPHMSLFSVGELLEQLAEEFGPMIAARGLELRVVPCRQTILSDQALLGEILRSLLGNALDHTSQGRILLGCRRHGEHLSIEVHDTGPGIPAGHVSAILHEPPLPEAQASFGLTLAQRLARQLDHRLGVRSSLGRGSCFSIELARAATQSAPVVIPTAPRTGVIFVIEGNAALRNLLVELLSMEGHRVVAAPDGEAALAMAPGISPPPAVILADHGLPGGLNGLQLGTALREIWGQGIPVLILAEDDQPRLREEIAAADCVLLQKPLKPHSLASLIEGLLPRAERTPIVFPQAPAGSRLIYLVDDDPTLCTAMRAVLTEAGYTVRDYPSAEAFLAAYQRGGNACLLVDARLPGLSGLELLANLREAGDDIPSVMITGYTDLPTAVLAMRRGASDFVTKPVRVPVLLEVLDRAMAASRDGGKLSATKADAVHRLARLTQRQREILDRVLAGQPSKNIAADLGISRRTVEVHRAAIMRHMRVKSMPALVRLVLSAMGDDMVEPSG